MRKLNCLTRALLTASFCASVFSAHQAFAVDDTVTVEAKVQVLEQRDTQLNSGITELNARVAALETAVAKLQIAEIESRVDVVNDEIAKLVVEIASGEEALDRMSQASYDVATDTSALNEPETPELRAQELVYLKILDRVEELYVQIEALVEERGHMEAQMASVRVAAVSMPKKSGSADLDARLVAVNAEIAKVEAQIAATEKAKEATRVMPVPPESVAPDQAVTLVKQIVLDRHTSSLYRYWQRQDTLYKKANPWGDNYCRSVVVRGASGYACDATTWRHLSRGTVIAVPAGTVHAMVPSGKKVPTEIAVFPTDDNRLGVLDPALPVVSVNEKIAVQVNTQQVFNSRWVAVLAVLSGLFFSLTVFFYCRYLEERSLASDREIEIVRLKASLDEALGLAQHTHNDDCCDTVTPTPPTTNDPVDPSKGHC